MIEAMGWPEATVIIVVALAVVFAYVGLEHGWPDFRRKK
jgi:hypothetical protein